LNGKEPGAFLVTHSIREEISMSTSAVSSSSLNQQLHQYFQTRASDLQQLGQDLQSGNVTGAQSDVANITSLGQSGPFPNGEPFINSTREQDFTAIGQALQSGDLAGAQQAFSDLKSTFNPAASQTESGSNTVASTSTGPEIVLNLGGAPNGATPEQVTINLSNASSGGGEQLSLSVGNQGSPEEQFTLNLAPNSNQQIVLNLLGASSAGSGTGSSTGSGISVSA
jgi:hypothetical protein